MNIERIINVVDSHTQGEPTRVITGGLQYIKGETMSEKKRYMQEQLDDLRMAVMLEPRGHGDMFGSIITPPANPQADIGILFMDTDGYLNMCGHGTIGSVTVMLETGILPLKEHGTPYLIDTPAGMVKVFAQFEDHKVTSVTFENVPSFLYQENIPITLSDGRPISVDISFGGNFFALVNINDTGLKIEQPDLNALVTLGMEIRGIINKTVVIQHPLIPSINTVDLVEFYDERKTVSADAKNVVVFGNGQYDRSPCGTGTSAKVAALYAKGKLPLGKKFYYESIHGTIFCGEAVRDASLPGLKAVTTQITGSAFITGFHNLLIDRDDPLRYGLYKSNNSGS